MIVSTLASFTPLPIGGIAHLVEQIITCPRHPKDSLIGPCTSCGLFETRHTRCRLRHNSISCKLLGGIDQSATHGTKIANHLLQALPKLGEEVLDPVIEIAQLVISLLKIPLEVRVNITPIGFVGVFNHRNALFDTLLRGLYKDRVQLLDPLPSCCAGHPLSGHQVRPS